MNNQREMTPREEELFHDNMPLVYHIFHTRIRQRDDMYFNKLRNRTGYTEDDFIQEGMIGLLLAIRSYDESLSKFSTYAGMRIEFEMKRLLTSGYVVKYPSKFKSGDIARALDVSESLDQNIDRHNQSSSTYLEVLENDDAETLSLDTLMSIESGMNGLSDLERYVMKKTINGYMAKEIAEELGYTRSGISMIVKRSREKLRKALSIA